MPARIQNKFATIHDATVRSADFLTAAFLEKLGTQVKPD